MKRISLSFIVMLLGLTMLLSGCTQKSEALVVVTDATFPPFETVDELSKEIVGFDMDLIQAIAERASLNIEIQNISWDPLLAGMAECQYDMAISAITIKPERALQMGFSDPYTNAGQIVVVDIDNTTVNAHTDLAGLTVGAQIATTGAMQAEAIEGVTLKTYDTYELAFLDVVNGQIDAVIVDYPTAVAFVNQNADSLKLVGEVFTDESYGIAFCKTNTALIGQVNTALAELINDGTVQELENKWFAAD